jgi:4-hydroxy-3-methylbut-2-enyl diphosphate reductase
MQVLRADSAGFCFGVSRALRRLDEELALYQKKNGDQRGGLITLGPIIHNPLVMQYYIDQGVACEADPAAFRPGDRVIIRAHGIPRAVEDALDRAGVSIVDATCPKVKKAQLAIRKEQAKGGALLLFGEKEHPEVRGLLSYAAPNALVFGDLHELEDLPLCPDADYFLAAQTTQERAIFVKAKERIEQRLGRPVRALDTICDATLERQRETLELADKVEAMVVVGGLDSGNTRRLAEVARGKGIPTVHVESVAGIPEDFRRDALARAAVVGLTAGASTPDAHINAMQAFLESFAAEPR